MKDEIKKCFYSNLEEKLELASKMRNGYYFLLYDIKTHELKYSCTKCNGINDKCKGYLNFKDYKRKFFEENSIKNQNNKK